MKKSLMLLAFTIGLLSFNLADTQPTGSLVFLQTDGLGLFQDSTLKLMDSGSAHPWLSKSPKPYLTAGLFDASSVGPLPSTLAVIFLGIVTLVLTRQRR